MSAKNEIVAIALLSREDVKRFGFMLSKVYRIDETPSFEELLHALDRAEERLRSCRNSEQNNDPSSAS